MCPCLSQISKFFLVAVCALTLGAACFGQAMPTATEIPDSKVDIYGGYGAFLPKNSDIANHPYQDIYDLNATLSITGFFNHYIGVQAEGEYFSGPSVRGSYGQCVNGACSDRDPRVYTAMGGFVFRYPLNRFVPYAHALGGGARVAGPYLQPLTWGPGVTAGIGFDYILPYFHNHLAIRPIQADFQYAQINHGPLAPDGLSGGFGQVWATKLSGGIVGRFGVPEVVRPVEVGCTTQPASVFPGEPVAANASVVNLSPKKTPIFTWTSSGGKLTPHDSSAIIDTAGLAPGDYTVAAHMSVGKKASDQASCTAPFTVKAFEPPTISCSANPSSVLTGAAVNISTSGISPQNRPLTYSYSASAGQITGAGPTATLSTAGVAAGTITVTCNLVDDLGKTATATTTVSVQNPPVAVIPQERPLCSMSFERDRTRPVRVNNEAKACLDDIALTMNQQTDAQLFIIGNAAPDDHPQAGAERALNVRQYLTQEKGIDPSRIYLRVGDTSGRTARTMLVPAGATFSDPTAQTFDESSIKRRGQPYGTSTHTPVRHHRVAHPATSTTTPPQ